MPRLPHDKILFFKEGVLYGTTLHYQVTLLGEIISSVERSDDQYKALEIIDLNKHKVIRRKQLIQQYCRQAHAKPFVFFNYLN